MRKQEPVIGIFVFITVTTPFETVFRKKVFRVKREVEISSFFTGFNKLGCGELKVVALAVYLES